MTLERYHKKRLYAPQYKIMADSIMGIINTWEFTGAVSNIMDVGCSLGELSTQLSVLNDKDAVITKVGVDLSEEAGHIAWCRGVLFECLDFDKGINKVNPFIYQGGKHSLVTCMEVAEHVENTDNLLDFISNCTANINSTLVWSAAVPGQRGRGHINCQTYEWWTDKLKTYGWIIDNDATDKFITDVKTRVPNCYLNTKIYRKTV